MFSLRSKILWAYSIIILIGMILMVTIINFSTRTGYQTFVRQNDINISMGLREPLGEYYSIHNSWEDVKSVLQFPQQRIGQMRGMMNQNPDGDHGRNMNPAIILTDHRGHVLVNTNPGFGFRGDAVPTDLIENGVEIKVRQKTVGYLFVGSMLESGLSEVERRFLNKTTYIIIWVSIFILILSFIFSYLFSGKLAKPVSDLTKAVGEIEKGNFSRRVSNESNDEIGDLTRSFNKMAESLESNDQWRKQIIADSAHELRTPVSLIQGNLEMILDGVYESDKEHIQNIYDETLVLSRLIKELQLLSSADSGSMTLNREVIDINKLIENILNIFRAGEVKDKIRLVNSIDSPLPSIDGDYQKLKQVFSNVMANAFRHTPEGGSVEIRGNVRNSSILLVIEDSGPGIEHDDLDKIFERFYRTDSSRNRHHGGSGLGLAISREIVKLHGGEIYAESESGKGASIFISLPFKK